MAAAVSAAAAAAAASNRFLTASDLKWAVGGWLFFVAENAVLSENRTAIIDYLGSDETYHAVYGTCSTIATASILYSYRKLRQQQQSSVLAPISRVRLGIAGSVMSVGLILASQTLPKLQIPVELQSTGNSSNGGSENVDTAAAAAVDSEVQPAKSWNLKVRCPFDFTDKKKDDATGSTPAVTGLERITRHPGLWAFGLAAAGNAALQPTAALTVWMLGPALTAWLGGSHTDSRYRRGLGGTMDADYADQTSNIPFAAMLTGRHQQGADSLRVWMTQELKPLNAAVAVAVACTWVATRGRASARGTGGSAALLQFARKAA